MISFCGHRVKGGYGVRHGRSHAKKQPHKRRSFAEHFKAATVEQVLSGTKTVGQVAS